MPNGAILDSWRPSSAENGELLTPGTIFRDIALDSGSYVISGPRPTSDINPARCVGREPNGRRADRPTRRGPIRLICDRRGGRANEASKTDDWRGILSVRVRLFGEHPICRYARCRF